MLFRARFFGLLALLSLAWIVYGFVATGNAASNVLSTPVASGSDTVLSKADAQAATNAGVALGTGLGLTVFACTGLPFLLVFGLLSWRNSVGLKTQKRHEETLDVMRNAPR